MIAAVKPFRSRRPSRAWQAGFLAMLPKIVRHACVILPRLRPEARADALQEVIAYAAVAYARLAELGKTDVAYPTPLAAFGVAQYRAGRRVGNRLNSRDVLSEYAQRSKRFRVETLDHYDDHDGTWVEAVVQDTRSSPVPEVVAFRCDFSDWLKSLSRRDRRLAEFLALGNRTNDTARKFNVSAGRVSQLRRDFEASWRCFQGEPSTQSDATGPA